MGGGRGRRLRLALAVALVSGGSVGAAGMAGAGARLELPTWMGEAFREANPAGAAGAAAAGAAPRAVLETPHDCRLSRLHPRLQEFIAGPLRHYHNVEWRQNGVEPGRIIIFRGGLIYSIVELDRNPGDVQDLLHNHGILPTGD